MRHTLVTFLGRTPRTDAGGYRQATYRFPNGFERRSACFGLTLTEYLKPDRVVILGTPGSMWSVLVEDLATQGDGEGARIELMEAEEQEDACAPLGRCARPVRRQWRLWRLRAAADRGRRARRQGAFP